MKTRLLSFLLFSFFGSLTAQINVSEGFESGITPAGWSVVGGFGTFNSAVPCAGTKSVYAGLYNANTFAYLRTSGYLSDGNQINVSFNYKRTVGAFAGVIRIYYDVNGSDNWVELVNSSYFNANSCDALNGYIGPGVIPVGSSIRFRLQANWSSGTTTVYIDDFSAVQTPMPLYSTEYTFDTTYNNTVGTNPFTSSNTSFAADRNGQTLKAMNVNANSTAAIPVNLLPVSNYSRTVSVWYKTNTNGSYPGIFSYGAAANSQTFGVYLNPSGGPIFQGYANDYDFGGTYNANTWQHLVVSYNGTAVKMYMNGALLGTRNYSLNTGVSDFKLGNNTTTIAFDDLKIYNYVLSDAEITNLYTNNTLSTSDFNQNKSEVKFYPNPAHDVLTIETALEIQSIEIFTVQGQKVLSTNQKQINVSDLAAGMYMVKIQDAENNSISKKIIIK